MYRLNEISVRRHFWILLSVHDWLLGLLFLTIVVAIFQIDCSISSISFLPSSGNRSPDDHSSRPTLLETYTQVTSAISIALGRIVQLASYYDMIVDIL